MLDSPFKPSALKKQNKTDFGVEVIPEEDGPHDSQSLVSPHYKRPESDTGDHPENLTSSPVKISLNKRALLTRATTVEYNSPLKFGGIDGTSSMKRKGARQL